MSSFKNHLLTLKKTICILSSSPNLIFSKMEESEWRLWRVDENDWQLIYTASDYSIGAPQCLQGLGDPLYLLAGLIGQNCLHISVNTLRVKFTASDNPHSTRWLRTTEKSRWLQRMAEQNGTNHNKAIMLNILKPQTGTSIHILIACFHRGGQGSLTFCWRLTSFEALVSNWLGNQEEEERVMTKQHCEQ